MRRWLTAVVLGLAILSTGGQADAQESPNRESEAKPFVIRTSPPVVGFALGIDDQVVATDANGEATFMLATRENIRERVKAVDSELLIDAGTRFRFNKFQRFTQGSATATFNVDYLVDFTFRDLAGNSVEPGDIDALVIKASTGQVNEYPAGEPIWLQGMRVLANNVPREIYWTVQDVVMDGASVVNRAQQRLTPAAERSLDVELLIYDLAVRVRSRLLGADQRGSVVLTYPNGAETRHDLRDGEVVIAGVPRGEYEIVAEGNGLSVTRPVLVSRNQPVELWILTWLELLVAAALVVAFFAVPVWLGRRRRRGHGHQHDSGSEPRLQEVGP